MEYDDTSDTSLGAHAVDSKILYAELLKYGGYRQGAIRRLPASQLTPSWLKNNGTFRPVLIPAPDGGDGGGAASPSAIVKTPAGGITAETLINHLGPTVPVQTFDSPSQEQGPLWTLHQWRLYWNKKTLRQTQGASKPLPDVALLPSSEADPPLEGIDKDYIHRLFSVPALPITGTPLETQVSAPTAVQAVDLRTTLGVKNETNKSRAQLPILLGMYPSKSFVNATMAPAGASVWIHVVSGTASIAVSPPVPKNLATFAAWACGGKTAGIFLHSKCEGSAKAELTAGDTLILPPGYSYSFAVTSSAVVLSGGFLRADSLAIHLDALRIEEAAGVNPRRQYPELKQLMWQTARKYAALLADKARSKMEESLENFDKKVASRALEMEKDDRKVAERAAAKARAQAAAAAAKGASRPSSAAAGAATGTGRRGTAGGGRRKKRPADDFIESDSDWSAGFKGKGGGGYDDDDDDEAEWVPGARQQRGIADSEENSGEEEEFDDILDSDAEEDDFYYSDDEDASGGGGGGKKRKKGGKRAGTNKVVAERPLSKRQRALRRNTGEMGGEDEEEDDTMAAAPSPALKFAGMPPSSLKVKLKLPMTASKTATDTAVEQQSKPTPIKLTIKLPAAANAGAAAAAEAPPPPPPTTTAPATIPQLDGPNDDDHIELSEGEEQGLPVLYITLRQWLRESPAAAVTAFSALSQNPWTVLAQFELVLKGLKLLEASSDDEDHPPPVCVNLTAVSKKTLDPTGAPLQQKLTLPTFASTTSGGGVNNNDDHGRGNNYGGDVDSLDDESGDNAAMIDDIEDNSDQIYRRGGGGGASGFGGGRPSSAMGAANSDGKGASNGGGLGPGVGGVDGADAPKQRPHAPSARGTPGGTGGKAPLSNPAAAKMKKLPTKDRLKKKLGL